MKPILVFQTDFTYKEGAVSSMYGVVKTVDRELEIMDGTHEPVSYTHLDVYKRQVLVYEFHHLMTGSLEMEAQELCSEPDVSERNWKEIETEFQQWAERLIGR